MRASRDCWIVEGPLPQLLRAFVLGWNATRPSKRGQFASDDRGTTVPPLTAQQWLVQETGLPESTVEKMTTVTGREDREFRTELRIADGLLAAINRTELLTDGSLRVLPNPRAAREDCASCWGEGSSPAGTIARVPARSRARRGRSVNQLSRVAGVPVPQMRVMLREDERRGLVQQHGGMWSLTASARAQYGPGLEQL